MKFENMNNKQLVSVLLMVALAIGAFAVLAAPEAESSSAVEYEGPICVYVEGSPDPYLAKSFNDAMAYAYDNYSNYPKIYVHEDVEAIGGMTYDFTTGEPGWTIEIYLEDENGSYSLLFNPSKNDGGMFYSEDSAHNGITFLGGSVSIIGGTIGCTDFNREAKGMEDYVIRNVISVENNCNFELYLTTVDGTNVSYKHTADEKDIECDTVTIINSSISFVAPIIIANEDRSDEEFPIYTNALVIEGLSQGSSIAVGRDDTMGRIEGDIWIGEDPNYEGEVVNLITSVNIDSNICYDCPKNKIRFIINDYGPDPMITGSLNVVLPGGLFDYKANIQFMGGKTDIIEMLEYAEGSDEFNLSSITLSGDNLVLDHVVSLAYVRLIVEEGSTLELTKEGGIEFNEECHLAGNIRYGNNVAEFGTNVLDDVQPVKIYEYGLLSPIFKTGEFGSIGFKCDVIVQQSFSEYGITVSEGKFTLYNDFFDGFVVPMATINPDKVEYSTLRINVCSGSQLRLGFVNPETGEVRTDDTIPLITSILCMCDINLENMGKVLGSCGCEIYGAENPTHRFYDLCGGYGGANLTVSYAALESADIHGALMITGSIVGGDLTVEQLYSLIAADNTVFEKCSVTLKPGSTVFVEKIDSDSREYTGLTMKNGSWFNFAHSKKVVLGIPGRYESDYRPDLYFKVEKGAIEGDKENTGSGKTVDHDYMVMWVKDDYTGEEKQIERLSKTIVFKVDGQVFKTLEGFEGFTFGFNFGEFPTPHDFFKEFKGWYFEDEDYYEVTGERRALKNTDIFPVLDDGDTELVLVADMHMNVTNNLIPVVAIIALIALVIGLVLRHRSK